MKKIIVLSLAILAFGAIKAQNDFIKILPVNSNHLYSIAFADAKTGYIGGEDAMFLKTVDGGVNWLMVNISTAPWVFSKMDIVQLQFLNKDTGFAVVGNYKQRNTSSYLWRTVDGGNNWTEVRITVNMVPWRIDATSIDSGIIGGSAFFQGSVISNLSGDSVVNLTSFSWDNGHYIEALARHKSNPNFIIAVTNMPSVHRSFDGGTTWDTVANTIDSAFKDIVHVNGNLWVASAQSTESIQISTDSGKTWKWEPTTFAYPAYAAIAISSTDSLVLAGYSRSQKTGEIFYFKNGIQALHTTPMSLNAVACNTNGDAFVVGDSGAIYRRDTRQTGLFPVQKLQPITVYPNPVNAILYFGNEVQGTIAIYDLNGNLVKGGTISSKTFDVRDLQVGPYLVSLKDAKTQEGLKFKILKE